MGKQVKLGFDESEIDTVLANDIKFKGKLKFTKALMIKGNFEGEINSPDGKLFIDEDAKIKAEIEAHIVANRGYIKGRIKAIDKLEMYNGSVIQGDISCQDLYVESGANFNGNSKMKPVPEIKADFNVEEIEEEVKTGAKSENKADTRKVVNRINSKKAK